MPNSTVTPPHSDSIEHRPGTVSASLIDAAVEILTQGERLLESLSDEQFAQPVPVAFNASIGGHYRHCLDHFSIFLAGAGEGWINYDRRQRDHRLETDRQAAGEMTRTLRQSFSTLDVERLNGPIRVTCAVQRGGESHASASTPARELNYVVAHAIHHYALIAVIAGVSGIRLPSEFGVAPSTLNHRDRLAAVAA